MIQAVIKCFRQSTVKRIEENLNDVFCCLFIRYCKWIHIKTDMTKWGTNIWQIGEMTLHKAGSSAVFNITLEREGKKRSYYNTGYSYLVTHPSMNPARQGLALLGGRDMVLSLWYGDSTLNAFILISKMRKGSKERKNHWYWLGK